VYFVIVTVVGVWTKYVRSLKDWVIGDLPFAIIFGHMVATLYSGMSLIGASAFAELWPVACLLIVSAVFGPRIWKYARENNLLTIPDLFEHYFGSSKFMRVLAVILVFVTVVTLLIAQWTAVGMGLILGVPYWISVLVGTVIVIAYTFSGGMWAVAVIDLIQFIVFAATVIVIAAVTIPAFGGLDGILNKLGKIDPKLLEPLGRAAPFIWPYIVTHYVVQFLGISVHPRMVHRIYSNKKVEYFKWLPLAGVLGYGISLSLTEVHCHGCQGRGRKWLDARAPD
jgi:Na+/proline symporter